MKKLLWVLLVCWVAGCRDAHSASDELNNKGYSKLQDEDYKGGIECFNKAIQANPGNPYAYCNRGLAKDMVKDYKGAIEDLHKAVEIKPDYAIAYYRMALVNEEENDSVAALSCYNKAIAIYPYFGAAINNRGIMKCHFQDYKGAIEDFTNAIKVEPRDTNRHDYKALSYTGRSMVKYYLKDTTGEFEDIDSAIAADPADPHALILKCRYEYELNEYTKAYDDCMKALGRSPQLPAGHFYEGLINIKIGYKDAGCGGLQRALNMGVPNAQDSINKYCR